jgi:hypothetical protein
MNNIKISTNRSFGVVFFFVFLIIGIYFFLKHSHFSFVIFGISTIFLILGIFNSKLLFPFNYVSFKFGVLLSRIMSPIILGLVFFLVVTPIAIIAKVFRKDFLRLNKKKNKKKATYWITEKDINKSMKDQF